MATIRKRGDKWHVQIRRQGCPTSTRSFNRRSDAQRWANQTEIEADRKGLTNDRKVLEQFKVADLLTRFKDTVIPNRRGKAVETFVLDAFLRRDLAQTRLSALTPDALAGI